MIDVGLTEDQLRKYVEPKNVAIFEGGEYVPTRKSAIFNLVEIEEEIKEIIAENTALELKIRDKEIDGAFELYFQVMGFLMVVTIVKIITFYKTRSTKEPSSKVMFRALYDRDLYEHGLVPLVIGTVSLTLIIFSFNQQLEFLRNNTWSVLSVAGFTGGEVFYISVVFCTALCFCSLLGYLSILVLKGAAVYLFGKHDSLAYLNYVEPESKHSDFKLAIGHIEDKFSVKGT